MTEATHLRRRRGVSEYEIETRPSCTFKNVAEPVTVYALTLASQPHVANLPTDPVCRMAVDPNESPEPHAPRRRDLVLRSPEAVVYDRHPDRYAVDT